MSLYDRPRYNTDLQLFRQSTKLVELLLIMRCLLCITEFFRLVVVQLVSGSLDQRQTVLPGARLTLARLQAELLEQLLL